MTKLPIIKDKISVSFFKEILELYKSKPENTGIRSYIVYHDRNDKFTKHFMVRWCVFRSTWIVSSDNSKTRTLQEAIDADLFLDILKEFLLLYTADDVEDCINHYCKVKNVSVGIPRSTDEEIYLMYKSLEA